MLPPSGSKRNYTNTFETGQVWPCWSYEELCRPMSTCCCAVLSTGGSSLLLVMLFSSTHRENRSESRERISLWWREKKLISLSELFFWIFHYFSYLWWIFFSSPLSSMRTFQPISILTTHSVIITRILAVLFHFISYFLGGIPLLTCSYRSVSI